MRATKRQRLSLGQVLGWHLRTTALAGIWLLSISSTPSQAQAPCQPKTALEQIYCKIQTAGGGAELPSFNEFRQNPPTTQQLLLNRPAKKYGLSLPPAPRPAQATRASPAPQAVAPAPPSSAPNNPPVTAPREVRATPPVLTQPLAANLKQCQLAGEQLLCPNKRFQLQFNLHNSQLAPGMLSPANRLELAPRPREPHNLEAYLNESYSRYIHKMLDIGLAASTLTFGKFCGIYAEVGRQGVDFAARFTAMYRFLQQDKLTLQAPKRFTQALPQGLNQCAVLSDELIICDDGKTNWIYRSHLEPALGFSSYFPDNGQDP